MNSHSTSFNRCPCSLTILCFIGNYFYSGIQNGIMGDILATKGLKSFYGYGYSNGRSYTVTNDLCWRSEDTIVSNLIARDTTGIAHLANNNTIQLQDDLLWKEKMPFMKKRMAEEYSIFGPQTLNHHLDKGYHFEDCGDTIIDIRDGQKYPTVCIGEQVWMAKNLNYAGAGVCYDNNPGNCNTYGRLYSITELTNLDTSSANPSGVPGLCPEGWHVPSTAEWTELFLFAIRAEHNIETPGLRATTGWPLPNNNTNALGLSLLPGGRHGVGDTTSYFDEMGKVGHFWSSSAERSPLFYCSVLVSRNNYNDDNDQQYLISEFEWYFSCRCVKD